MFGDKKLVIESAIHTHANLHKRHIALSFHQFQEDIEYKAVASYHVSVWDNPDDILSNNLSYTKILDLELKREGGQENITDRNQEGFPVSSCTLPIF